MRAVIVIEVGGGGCGTGDGDFFDRSTGCAMSTCSSMRRGEPDDVECGDWKYRGCGCCCDCDCWSIGGDETGRPLGVGDLRLPRVVVVMTLAELANGELARSLAANGQPFAKVEGAVDAPGDGDSDSDEEDAGLRRCAARLAPKSAADSRLM